MIAFDLRGTVLTAIEAALNRCLKDQASSLHLSDAILQASYDAPVWKVR